MHAISKDISAVIMGINEGIDDTDCHISMEKALYKDWAIKSRKK